MKRYVAELVGTFVLVFGGCGSAVLAGDKIGFAGVSFAFGLSLLAMVYAIGPISGCHINPAVTVGLLLARKVQAEFAAGYAVAQVVGPFWPLASCCSSPRPARSRTTPPSPASRRMATASTPRGAIISRRHSWWRSSSQRS
jgi:glycerol uptake facilitator-like aquaporin